MPVVLPEPNGVVQDPRGGETPVWQCPHCGQLKHVEDFGWPKRDGFYPDQDVWHKQSWCRDCRGKP